MLTNARVMLGGLLLTGMALAWGVGLYRQSAALGFRFQDLEDAPVYEERLGRLREMLPRHATVGYVDDFPAGPLDTPGKFLLTQYVLAPVLVVPGPHQPLVIRNMHRPQNQPLTAAERRWTLVEDLGNGVHLYRTETD